ncbi:TIGR03943 family protein [Clostridium sp. YIM B02551]|uniref:TIGR03943 family putative permease subunit n=1 Tax=Clostridium sp. YIM B02551 TaxID=2910679 RepID=UPI001EEC8D7D|nr:TIGR03943 family protein [Clostridium sp. YIM B02551]
MKRFNTNEFFKFLIFLLLSLFLFNLTSTGKIKLFIAPRIIVYLNIFQVFLSLLTVYQFGKIFTTISNRPSSKVIILFIFTILVGFGASHAGIDTTIVDTKGVKAVNKLANVAGQMTPEERKRNLPLNINDNNFVNTLSDVFQHINDYNGRAITLSGFVHKQDGLNNNEFIISRLYMSCCAADAQIIGPIGRLRDSTELKEGQWVTVQGKLSAKSQATDGQLTTTPVVIIDSVKTIPKPNSPYVYNN